MNIKTFNLGGTNCYIVWDSQEAAVIDPADSSILSFINENSLTVKYIILTHCHFDHIGGVRSVADKTYAKIAIHKNDACGLTDNRFNLGMMLGEDYTQGEPDILLSDGDILNIGDTTLKILHTPGHTPGGIGILANESVLFAGDTLFRRSVGRSDFPGGNHTVLINSIKTKFMPLSDDTAVYPGHDAPTSIGEERMQNPYIMP